MTLKYESEILFDLMKRDGVSSPSDVLPYESELKEKYLEQVEGAYPKLQDYRSEWMNYNLVAHLPADFPVETLSNVTEATVDNVVPYAYGSAILKGQTLVNLIRTIGKTHLEQYQDTVSLIHVKPSTKYLLKIKNNTSEAKSFYSSEITEWTKIDIEANQTITKTLTTKSTLGRNTLLQNLKTHTTEHDLSIIFIEYQDGMENWDIPYFEGMQSVKMPVLTTSNEDDTKSNILSCNEDVELGSVGEVKDELNLLTGQLAQRTETRAYQEGDEANSEVITDKANTRYKLPEESIKTVDLSCINEQGKSETFRPIEGTMHLMTEGETIKPTFSGEIPVEAITQNLTSFIEE